MTYDVIVVGSGLAGLSACHTLTQMGREVLLLEASDHIGGRVFGLNFKKGLTYQATSVSVQAEDQLVNPLQAILTRHNIATKPLSSINSETFDSYGNSISLKELHSSLTPEYNKALMRIQEAKRLEWTNPPVIAEILQYQDKTKGIPETDSLAYWARKFITASISQHTGASLDEVSLLEFLQDEWGGEEDHIIIENANTLTEALYEEANATQNLTTSLNTKVTKIYLEVAGNGKGKKQEENTLLVIDHKGNHHNANSIVVAVPFSILKHHKIQFSPELSAAKKLALERFGISHYNLVFLEFEQAFWNKEVHYVFPNGPTIEDWPQYLNACHFSPDKKPILIAQFTGKRARFSDKTDAVIVEETLLPLKRAYGQKISPLKSFHISRFDTDPNILGGSLYCSKKNHTEDFEALSKPEGGCYFAGDYIYAKRHGRLEAAFESGLQAGLEVEAYLRYKKDLEIRMEDALRPKF